MQFEKAVKTLEFDKIREAIALCAPTSAGADAARELMPSATEEGVSRLQRQTRCAMQLLVYKGMPPVSGASDIEESVGRAVKGSTLSPGELRRIADLLFAAAGCKAYYSQRDERRYSTALPGEDENGEHEDPLGEVFSYLIGDKFLAESIRSSIISEDLISDNASPALSDIRRQKSKVSGRIREILNKYITSSAYQKCLQEPIVTTRGGRAVIPVKAECRNDIKGLVHDTSSSGATLFIEPMAVVEANNELRVLERKEELEIERILYEFSAAVAKDEQILLSDCDALAKLSLIFAKAKYADNVNARTPYMSKTGTLRLVKARHPLLDPEKAVPISASIGKDAGRDVTVAIGEKSNDYTTLVITGPNTGGKTVTLKTIGLLSMMYQAGVPVPADERSEFPVFSDILADIGDEQSIEQSLSTFSAHMTNIVRILESIDKNALVLIDELGAGTDPVEGAALAVAVLERIRESGALCAATTHYAELKNYAVRTEGVMNAGCEFDVETLRPTYKLIIGAPGRSNAFKISRRLGLPEEIILRAASEITEESERFENVIDKLEAARSEMEKQKADAEAVHAEYERLKAESDRKIASLEASAEKELERARAEAKKIISSAKASSEFIFAELNKAKKAAEKNGAALAVEEAKRKIRKELKDNSDNYDPTEKPKEIENRRPIRRGDEVLIAAIGRRGIVQTEPDKNGNTTVMTGSIVTKTNVKGLKLLEEDEIKRDEDVRPKPGVTASAPFSPTLDLRGMYADDACFALDKYLDEAKRSGLTTLTIIHGKGTGVLRKAVGDFLKNDKRVRSHRIGNYGEGDAGVTVVEI